MFQPSNKVIIIDDIDIQLMKLAEVFLKNGIGCRTILYDASYSTPLSGVRIAFIDINLLGKSFNFDQDVFDYKKDSSLSSVFNDLVFAINNCIDRNNGPYALVFWSKTVKVIPNFIKYVNDRKIDLPSPIFVDAIDKDEFIGKSSFEFQQKFDQIFENKSIRLLFEFENNCEIAAWKTVNEIYELIPGKEKNNWEINNEFETNFDIIFSSIAKETLGIEYAQLNPDKAVHEALMPIINHRIINDSIIKNEWKRHLKSINTGNIEYPSSFQKGILNSTFHIDTVSNVETNVRGAVYEYNIVPLPFQIAYYFSLELYFRKLENYISEYFFKLGSEVSKETKKLINEKSKFIVIEISSSCDYSQNKKRNSKFVLGLKTPKFDKNLIKSNSISNSVFYKEIPEFCLNNEEFYIWINLNFVISNISKIKNFGKPLFILKKEIMDMIGNRYANHVSRIGITSFR